MDSRLDKLHIKLIRLLQELDSYGYSREETINELNSERPDIEREVVTKYFDLKSRIDERLNHMNSSNAETKSEGKDDR